MPAVDEKWNHCASPHFELFSRNRDRDSRDLLQDLELLRAVFIERFKLVERVRLDLTVYFFRTREDLRAYLPEAYRANEFFQAFYHWRPDRAVIMIAPVENEEAARRLIYHEYVHHLFRSTGYEAPVWFNEGVADLLSTVHVAGKNLEIGRPNEARLRTLQHAKLLPLETLFGVTHTSPIYRANANDHTGLFYAQSWALLHYWYFGQSGVSRAAIDRFVRSACDQRLVGPDLRAAFRELLGMDYPGMEQRLESYVQSGSYRFGLQTAPVIAAPKTYASRAVSRDEMRLRLAELALRVNRSGAAKLVLLDFVAGDQSDPRPFEALGCDALADRDFVTVRERWEQAIEAGTRNIAIYRELALMESRDWFRRFDYYFRLPSEHAVRLRSRLLRAIEYGPDQSSLYEMLAWVEAFAPEPVIANVNLVQTHFPALQQKARTVLALAFVRVRVNQPDAAKQLLTELESLQPDRWVAQAAEVLRAKLEGRAPRRPPPKGGAATENSRSRFAPPLFPSPSIELPHKKQ